MGLRKEEPPETEKCGACNGTGKCTWIKGRESCPRCNGAGKLTQSEIQHDKFCSNILDDMLGKKKKK